MVSFIEAIFSRHRGDHFELHWSKREVSYRSKVNGDAAKPQGRSEPGPMGTPRTLSLSFLLHQLYFIRAASSMETENVVFYNLQFLFPSIPSIKELRYGLFSPKDKNPLEESLSKLGSVAQTWIHQLWAGSRVPFWMIFPLYLNKGIIKYYKKALI